MNFICSIRLRLLNFEVNEEEKRIDLFLKADTLRRVLTQLLRLSV